jgi:hypothetical protein
MIVTWVTLNMLSSVAGIAIADDYKTIDQSPDIDTTSIHVYMNNKTNDTMRLSKPSEKQANGTVPISKFEVLPREKLNYVMDFPREFSSISFAKPAQIVQPFAYASGLKECRFEANIQVALKKEGDAVRKTPHWSGMVESVGKVPADCSADILEDKHPYSYSIEFSME